MTVTELFDEDIKTMAEQTLKKAEIFIANLHEREVTLSLQPELEDQAKDVLFFSFKGSKMKIFGWVVAFGRGFEMTHNTGVNYFDCSFRRVPRVALL